MLNKIIIVILIVLLIVVSYVASDDVETYELDEENNGQDGTTPVFVIVEKSKEEWKEEFLKDVE